MSTTTLDLREIKAALYNGLLFNTLASLKEKVTGANMLTGYIMRLIADTLARRKTHMLARDRGKHKPRDRQTQSICSFHNDQ